MATPVKLPELGESVTEGTVTRWLKSVGDEVAVDESLLEVSTDKVDTEIPSPAAGRLLEIKVDEDETVDVGAELAVIGSRDAAPGGGPPADSGDSPPAATHAEPQQARAAGPAREEAAHEEAAPEPGPPAAEEQPGPASPEPQEPAAEAAPAPSGDRDSSAYVTPLVRKMAAQHSVDLASIVGTGVGGRIRKQ